MTATSYSNMKGIDSLEQWVGKENIISYNMQKAIDNNIVRPLNYFPCVLNYSKECKNKLIELRHYENISPYVIEQINKLESIMDKLNTNLANVISYYIKGKISLNAAEGGRVFVFFNRDSDVIEHKDAICKSLRVLYEQNTNRKVNIRYIKYTASNSKNEDELALKIIGNEPEPFTIDVISTVNRGAEGIHPSKIHFGMIMCGTQSIQRYVQMMGRVTNLYEYDDFDTNIFDFRDNRTFLGMTNIYVGVNRLKLRSKVKSERALIKFSDDNKINENALANANIERTEELEETIGIYEKIERLNKILKVDKELALMISSNLESIDEDYEGNIFKFLSNMYSNAELKNKQNKFTEIQKAFLFAEFNNQDLEEIKKNIGDLGYRWYVSKHAKKEEIEKVKKVYNYINSLKNDSNKKISKWIKEEYAIDYMANNVSSYMAALLQSNHRVEESLISYISSINPAKFGCTDRNITNMCVKIINYLRDLDINTLSKEELQSVCSEVIGVKLYLEQIQLDTETDEVYVNTVIKFIQLKYKHILEADSSLYYRKTANRLMQIINAEKKQCLNKLNQDCNVTIGYIANNFDTMPEIYKVMIKLAKVNNVNAFNNRFVYESLMYELLTKAINNKDKHALYELDRYISIDKLPYKIANKIKNSKEIKKLRKDISRHDVKCMVQSLNCRADASKVISRALKTGVVNEVNIIAMAFPGIIETNMQNIAYSIYRYGVLSPDEQSELNNIKLKFGNNNISNNILLKLLKSSILSKEAKNTIKQINSKLSA